MHLIPVKAIKIKEGRQRQEFEPEALMELMESVETRLLHPIVVRPAENEGEYYLVAGERRMKVISDLRALGKPLVYSGKPVPDDLIPATLLEDLDELDAEEMELDENIRRQDLTWQEHAQALARLDSLRKKQYARDNEQAAKEAEAKGEEPPEPKKYTVADLAEETRGSREGYNAGITRKELIVSKHLDNPKVAKAKSVDEAFKILKKEEKQKDRQQKADVIGATFNSSVHNIYNDSCLNLMAQPDWEERFDVILTDPPYGMGADNFSNSGGRLTTEHNYDDSYESWKKLMTEWAKLAYQVAKPNAHAYVFCDIDNFHELKEMLQAEGWYVFRTPILALKPNSGRVPLPEYGPRRQWEMILYAMKGKKEVNQIYPDYFEARGDRGVEHAAQKPVEAYSNLLQRSVQPGDKVLDSFGGSGTLIPAAHSFKCEATVIEMDKGNYSLCVERLEALDKQPDLLDGLN